MNRKKIIVISVFITILVVILEIWALNRLATLGPQLIQIEESSNLLRLENQIFKEEIARKSSYLKIRELSSQLGFHPVKSVQYLKPSN